MCYGPVSVCLYVTDQCTIRAALRVIQITMLKSFHWTVLSSVKNWFSSLNVEYDVCPICCVFEWHTRSTFCHWTWRRPKFLSSKQNFLSICVPGNAYTTKWQLFGMQIFTYHASVSLHRQQLTAWNNRMYCVLCNEHLFHFLLLRLTTSSATAVDCATHNLSKLVLCFCKMWEFFLMLESFFCLCYTSANEGN